MVKLFYNKTFLLSIILKIIFTVNQLKKKQKEFKAAELVYLFGCLAIKSYKF